MEENHLRTELKKAVDYKGCNINQCDWSRLAVDVLSLIIQHLPIMDRIAISSVCRSWRSVVLSVRPYDKLCYSLPCLVYMRESTFHLLDPLYRHKHMFEIPSLKGAEVLCARDGWLLMSRRLHTEDDGMRSMFFFNLLSKARIELPPLTIEGLGHFCVSDRPSSPSCVVVGFLLPVIFDVVIGFCRQGDDRWTIVERPCSVYWWGFTSNVVCCFGSFYCLDGKGNLGVFSLSEQTWTIIERQRNLDLATIKQREHYLVECDGNLLWVCDLENLVVVFRFDTLTNKWVSVKDLGDKVLFVGRQDSVSTTAKVKSMKGRICFNRVQGEHVVSCSLESKEPTVSAPGSGNFKEFLFSSWVDLEWSQPTPQWSRV